MLFLFISDFRIQISKYRIFEEKFRNLKVYFGCEIQDSNGEAVKIFKLIEENKKILTSPK